MCNVPAPVPRSAFRPKLGPDRAPPRWRAHTSYSSRPAESSHAQASCTTHYLSVRGGETDGRNNLFTHTHHLRGRTLQPSPLQDQHRHP